MYFKLLLSGFGITEPVFLETLTLVPSSRYPYVIRVGLLKFNFKPRYLLDLRINKGHIGHMQREFLLHYLLPPLHLLIVNGDILEIYALDRYLILFTVYIDYFALGFLVPSGDDLDYVVLDDVPLGEGLLNWGPRE